MFMNYFCLKFIELTLIRVGEKGGGVDFPDGKNEKKRKCLVVSDEMP